jgi:hypothetical protein
MVAFTINGVTGGASPYENNVDNVDTAEQLIIQILLQAITLSMYAMPMVACSQQL